MTQVSVYASQSRSNALRKENVIYQNVDLAFDRLPDIQRHILSANDDDPLGERRSPPGLRQVRSSERIIALGRAAHTVLADFDKRTLIADDIEAEEFAEDVGRFVWSCVNTSKVVALGEGAWRAVQMLPLTERRYHALPPLRMAHPTSAAPSHNVLVVNHDPDETLAARAADLFARRGYAVERTGRRAEAGAPLGGAGGWSGEASFHVHVGRHNATANEMRIIDTWHSRRFALQLLSPRDKSSVPDALMVDSEVNGMLCDTPEATLAACTEIHNDRVLQKKLLDAGARTVAPLARNWMTIVEDLLS